MCVSTATASPQMKRKAAGGHGGKGGDVYLEASRFVKDLTMSSFQYRGDDGEDATGRGNNGRAGKDRIVFVPLGTTVKELVRVCSCADFAITWFPLTLLHGPRCRCAGDARV